MSSLRKGGITGGGRRIGSCLRLSRILSAKVLISSNGNAEGDLVDARD